MAMQLDAYAHRWVIDTEFRLLPDGRPDVHCLVGYDLCTGRWVRLFGSQLNSPPPFDLGDSSLFVSYYAPAELACFNALGWAAPSNVVDMYAEFRASCNGLRVAGYSLPQALAHFGLPSAAEFDKAEYRDLAMRGGPFTSIESQGLLDYCSRDVVDLATLYNKMQTALDPFGAPLRGRFVHDVARIESNGIPVDSARLEKFYEQREGLERELIAKYDDLGVYADGRLSMTRLANYIESHYPHWPRTSTGRVKVDDETLEHFELRDSKIKKLRALKGALSQLRGPRLEFGAHDRSHPMLSPFGTRTGRNAPRSRSFVFALPKVMRGFIRPAPGMALAYIDWVAQEMGVAAALSGDENMREAYAAHDFYLHFAWLAGRVPSGATKEAYPEMRALYKRVATGVLYGMGVELLAAQTGSSNGDASALLAQHRKVFPQYWAWSDRVVMSAMLTRSLTSSMGWPLHVPASCDRVHAVGEMDPSERTVTMLSVRNYPMQANGADMMRLACAFAHDVGVRICAPVHDGFLIESPAETIDDAVAAMREAMDRASRLVLGGFVLKTAVESITRYPDHYPIDSADERSMWADIQKFLGVA